jgi:AraC-like DNA-binding protein
VKLLYQKLPLSEDSSFVCRTYRTPDFEVPWHHHIEFEIILLTEGRGLAFIGNDIGKFNPGDIFFIAKNIPHTFQKFETELIANAIVIQFKEDFFGKEFLAFPESKELKNIYELSIQGLKIKGDSKVALTQIIKELEHKRGLERIIDLLKCFEIISKSKEYKILGNKNMVLINQDGNEKMDKIFQFTIESFKKKITLDEVANIACMSVPAFCSYFKKRSKKTYINFLNEIRIEFSLSLLRSDKNINEICYESGFTSLANFNKQFLKIRKQTPSDYRKSIIEI